MRMRSNHRALALSCAAAILQGCPPGSAGGPGTFTPPVPYRTPTSVSEFDVLRPSEVSSNIWISEGPFNRFILSRSLVARGPMVAVAYVEVDKNLAREQYAVKLRRSMDGGATFLPAQTLTIAVGPTLVTSVNLSVDSCGTLTVWLEYQSAGLFIAQSSDSGQTFTPWAKVPVFDRSVHYMGWVVPHPPCGMLIAEVVHTDPVNSEYPLLLKGAADPTSLVLTDVPHTAFGHMWASSLEQDEGGRLFSVQVQLMGPDSVIHVYRSTDGGKTFEFLNDQIGPTLGYTPHLFFRPFLLSDGGNTVYLGWYDLKDKYMDRPRLMVARSDDGGAHFTSFHPATSDPEPGLCGATFPGALDPSGRVWVAYGWCDPKVVPGFYDAYSCEIRLTNSDPSFSGFSAPRRVNELLSYKVAPYNVQDSVSYPSLDLDLTTNTLHLLWLDSRYSIAPSMAHSYNAFYVHTSVSP